MTHETSSLDVYPLAAHPLVRAVLLAIVAAVAILLVTAIVGVAVAGPALDLAPDPAGMALPF